MQSDLTKSFFCWNYLKNSQHSFRLQFGWFCVLFWIASFPLIITFIMLLNRWCFLLPRIFREFWFGFFFAFVYDFGLCFEASLREWVRTHCSVRYITIASIGYVCAAKVTKKETRKRKKPHPNTICDFHTLLFENSREVAN